MSQNAGGSADANAHNNNGDSQGDECHRPPFTMHGVLHYLKYEWSRYEMERNEWEMERAELRARISFLVGERKAQESLKRDLVRRIKMLEYSLKQERAKVHRLTHDGQDPVEEEAEDFNPGVNSNVPMDVDAIEKGSFNSQTWREARQVLRQYLQEIGYSEKILDVRSFRVKNLLGFNPDNNGMNAPNEGGRKAVEKALLEGEKTILDTAVLIKQHRGHHHKDDDGGAAAVEYIGDEDSDSDNEDKHLDAAEEDALDEFSFLQHEAAATPNALDATNRKQPQLQQRNGCGNPSPAVDNYMMNPSTQTPAAYDIVDIKDDFSMAEEDSLLASQQQRWNIRFTLRSHYDSIRAMQFHPVEPILITASEDGTAKLWDLNNAFSDKSPEGKSSSYHQNPQPATGIVDVEPIYTFRGHKGPILAMDMSPTGDMCYTGGYDGTICCWTVPSSHMEVYQSYDSSVLHTRLTGHTDCIWSLAYHSSTNRLISASADGTIRLWEAEVVEGMQSLVKTFVPPAASDGSGTPLRPRSIDVVSTEPQQLLTAYSQAHCSILDLETGQNVLSFKLKDGSGENVGEINRILSHPTMPVTIMGGEDRKIRVFDNNTGKLVDTVIAHVEGISTLAIDPNGLYLLSGSHDGSLRLWNMEKRICLQEIAAHRKKYNMSVMSVAFHPSRPLIASAGADSLTKVFTTTNSNSGGGKYALPTQFPISSPPKETSSPPTKSKQPQQQSSPLATTTAAPLSPTTTSTSTSPSSGKTTKILPASHQRQQQQSSSGSATGTPPSGKTDV